MADAAVILQARRGAPASDETVRAERGFDRVRGCLALVATVTLSEELVFL